MPTPIMQPQPQRHDQIRQIIALTDATSLSGTETEKDIETLCQMAIGTERIPPAAAVCVSPAHVAMARSFLAWSPVKLATVINFPHGSHNPGQVAAETARAIQDGAQEIDLVTPLNLRTAQHVSNVWYACLDACDKANVKTKLILETGAWQGQETRLYWTAINALRHGFDFLKTSTGKLTVPDGQGGHLKSGATPHAVQSLLCALGCFGFDTNRGIKISGGVDTLDIAAAYLQQIAKTDLPLTPQNVRLGSSRLLPLAHAALS